MISNHHEISPYPEPQTGADAILTETEKSKTVEGAIAKIQVILTEVGAMGANDYEIPALLKIIKDVQEGVLPAEKGLEQAHQIRDSKQDYH